MHDPTWCGSSPSSDQRVELEVVADGPGRDTADSEFVMVFNGSDADIDLTGWMVQDTSPLNAYFFPKGSVVRADDYVVVYSSSGTSAGGPRRLQGRSVLLRGDRHALEQRDSRHRPSVR